MITEDRLWIPCSDCGELRFQEQLTLIADNGEGECARYVCDPACDAAPAPYAQPALPSWSQIGFILIFAFIFAWCGYAMSKSGDASLDRNYPAIKAEVRR